MTRQFAPATFTADATELRPNYHDCLTGARRWIERGLEEAQRLNDRQCETEFQAILDSFDSEASGLHDIIAEANEPYSGEPL
jgi:hypothetical protein